VSFQYAWKVFTATGSFSAAVTANKVGRLTGAHAWTYSTEEFEWGHRPNKAKSRVMIATHPGTDNHDVNDLIHQVYRENIARYERATDLRDVPDPYGGAWGNQRGII
jgi:hypothetical protein